MYSCLFRFLKERFSKLGRSLNGIPFLDPNLIGIMGDIACALPRCQDPDYLTKERRLL